MSKHYGAIAFTEAVRDVQRDHGSHAFYDRKRVQGTAVPGTDSLTEDEKNYLAERDSFYLATVSETGCPTSNSVATQPVYYVSSTTTSSGGPRFSRQSAVHQHRQRRRRQPGRPDRHGLPPPAPSAGSPHHFVDTNRQGPRWLSRRILADFTDAQFIGNEWASAGLLAGTVISHLLNPAIAGNVGNLLPELLTSQVLAAALAVALWHRQWATYGWYPTFVPVVSIAPATVLAFDGSVQAIITGAVLGALIGPPFAASVARRLPPHFHPFIGNVVSMAASTATIVTALSVMPGFG